MSVEIELLELAMEPTALVIMSRVCPERDRFVRAYTHSLANRHAKLWRVTEDGRDEVPHWDRERVLRDDSVWGAHDSLPRYEIEMTDEGGEYLQSIGHL